MSTTHTRSLKDKGHDIQGSLVKPYVVNQGIWRHCYYIAAKGQQLVKQIQRDPYLPGCVALVHISKRGARIMWPNIKAARCNNFNLKQDAERIRSYEWTGNSSLHHFQQGRASFAEKQKVL